MQDLNTQLPPEHWLQSQHYNPLSQPNRQQQAANISLYLADRYCMCKIPCCVVVVMLSITVQNNYLYLQQQPNTCFSHYLLISIRLYVDVEEVKMVNSSCQKVSFNNIILT